MEKRLLHSLAFLLCALFSMAQGRFCVGMLHYEVLSETGRVVHVYDTSFPWKEAVSVDIPETVSYNGKDYTVRAIGNCPFRGCTALQAINVASGNARYKSVDGVLFDHKGSLLKTYPEGRKQKTYTVPYLASMIECFAFENCKLLESVQIPGSVVEIGAAAFSGCSALKEVSLPNSVTEINEFVFENCTSFREFIIPRSVTKIGNFAFSDCCSLRKIQIPESVTRIGKGAFSYCCSLQEVINLADEPQEIVHPVLGHAHIFAPETLQSARLFVKPSNLEKFKSTGGWKEFRTIVSY